MDPNELTLVYEDHLGHTHVEQCHTGSNYIIRAEELEAQGYRVIGG